jgi:5-methylcytosine-specific restriction enzyme subunit McrC
MVLGLGCGHLVYAKGSEAPAHHVVRRSGVEIICYAVDLDAEPAALLHQMRDLASHIAASSARPPIGWISLASV